MKQFISLTLPARSARRRRARCLIAERLEDRTLLSTFSVSNTDDHGPGSLRQAIVDANDNANMSGVPNEIDCDIAGSGLQVISPLTGLPPITDPVVIDGYTQPGSSPNTVLDGDSATLLIVPDGSLALIADGLQLYAGSSMVRGLAIKQFTIGINVSSPGSNVLAGIPRTPGFRGHHTQSSTGGIPGTGGFRGHHTQLSTAVGYSGPGTAPPGERCAPDRGPLPFA